MNKHFGLMFSALFACFPCTRTLPASDYGSPDSQPEPRTLTIQEAVRMPLPRSPDVVMVEAQAARAGDAVRESRSMNRPQVVAGTGLAYNNGFPLSIEGAAPSIFQIGLSQS